MTDNLTQTAPRRIWLQVDTDDEDRSEPFPDDVGVTWAEKPVGGAEVEYVRADIAIEMLKALEHIMRCIPACGSCEIRWDSATWHQIDAAVANFRGAS